MTVAADEVEDGAGDADMVIMMHEAARDGGGGLRLAGNVHDKHDRDAMAGREGGGGPAAAGGRRDPIEQPHRRFNQHQLGVNGKVGDQGVAQAGGHRPSVEVWAGLSGGGGMEGGVDVVGAGLGGADADASAAKGGKKRQRQRGLARARAGRADDQAGGHAASGTR